MAGWGEKKRSAKVTPQGKKKPPTDLGPRGGATKNPRAWEKGRCDEKPPSWEKRGGVAKNPRAFSGGVAAAQGQGQGMRSDLGRPRRPLARQARARKHTHTDLGKKTQVVKKKNKEKKALGLRIVQRDPKETKAFTSLGLRGEKTK